MLKDNFTAYLYLGNEESNPTIKVTQGSLIAFHEISSLWLNNWTVDSNSTHTDSRHVPKKD